MRKLLPVIILVAVAVAAYFLFFNKKNEKSFSGQKSIESERVAVKNHSGEFNESVSTALNNYFELKASLVDADTAKVKATTAGFVAALNQIKTDELNKESEAISQSAKMQIEDISTNALALQNEHDLTEMRQDFRMISENLYPFLKTIKYEGPTLYWQNCPMAFGEDKEANWISNTKEIINPYLGKNHPEFKSSMLHCGEIKDTIK
ncbi:MAG: DUF3347 domain-containing protein [Ginsengibacter sp.]